MGMGVSGGVNLELRVPSILTSKDLPWDQGPFPLRGSQAPEFSLKPLSCHVSLFSQVQI